jgi:hypothetical protein
MTFEDWTIEGPLAEGGTATVHAAKGTSGPVVVKVLKRALADDPSWLARFDREQRALREVRHPNVVPILESGRTSDGLPYIVMPRIDKTLRSAIEEGPKPAQAWTIARAIGSALAAAHELGIVHRDVKPDNVMMDDGVPKLADFGLAKDIEGDPIKVTETGAPVGTPAYMAPEQWWGEGVGPRADQYALGIVLFELVAGHTPFASADGYAQMMQAHISESAPPLPHASEAARAFVARLLSKKPGERFGSMNEAIAAGDAAFGIASDRIETKRGAWPFAIAAPIALVIMGYGGLHHPRDWLHIAGSGGWPVPIVFAILGFVFWRRPSVLALALLPDFMGTTLTYTGWMATLGSVADAPIARRLVTYQEGVFESNVGRFAGGILSAGLLLSALPAIRGRARPQEVASLAVRLVALALVATSALAWIDGQSAHAFELASRAERAATIVRWDHVKTWTSIAIAVFVVGTLAHGALRVRRAPRATTLITRPAIVLAACWAALAALDAGFLSRIRETRHALWIQLAPEFELDAKLAPPSMEGLPDPPALPTIAISPDRVSVDAEPVGLAAALETPTGQRVLAADLSHAVAKEKDPRVLVAVDARVPWRTVRSALIVARDLGVREVVFLFQRGPAPVLQPGDPPEAAYVVPKDFGGLAVELEGGASIPAETTFDVAATELRKSRRLAL